MKFIYGIYPDTGSITLITCLFTVRYLDVNYHKPFPVHKNMTLCFWKTLRLLFSLVYICCVCLTSALTCLKYAWFVYVKQLVCTVYEVILVLLKVRVFMDGMLCCWVSNSKWHRVTSQKTRIFKNLHIF
jgi:hypothetical protein